jgi:hypothetical protein
MNLAMFVNLFHPLSIYGYMRNAIEIFKYIARYIQLCLEI